MEHTIAQLKEDFYLGSHESGGNCTALFGELSTNQDHILITNDNMEEPTDKDTTFNIGVYLNEEYGEPAHTFETTNVPHLFELVQSIYSLWGN